MSKYFIFSYHFLKLLCAGLVFFSTFAQAEWNEAWTNRQKVTLNVQGVTETVNNASLLIRLHSGNFDFTSANIDGSDIRLIAADDKTELPYYIEKYDAVNELAVIWVKIPQISQNIKDNYFWLYSGNEEATSNGSAKAVLDDHTVGLFPFKEDALLKDISNTSALATGTIAANTSGFIGSSATFSGQAMTIPTNPAYSQANGFTFSMWIKPASLPQTAVLWREGDQLTLRLDGQNLKLSLAGEEIAGPEIKAAVWQHVAVTWQSGKASLFVNGVEVASGQANLSDANSDIVIGDAYSGEMDELELDNVARTGSWVHVIFASQGVEGKWLTVAPPSGEGDEDEGGEANYIGILIENLTIDAKVVIAILAVMFFISAWVMWSKAVLVSKTDKDNNRFLMRFQKADTNDLLMLDKGANYPNSTLFGLYQAGLREIKKREHPEQKLALSGASMDAIKAAIDADLVRETQRLNNLMVLLTIAISGGPFLGLLGTVVGVMITFAAIAAAGDVNVNAIAPGIAAALLATVAGLGVAIPALFGYNYLASRIKNITIAMQIFVDEFVTRSAELFGKE